MQRASYQIVEGTLFGSRSSQVFWTCTSLTKACGSIQKRSKLILISSRTQILFSRLEYHNTPEIFCVLKLSGKGRLCSDIIKLSCRSFFLSVIIILNPLRKLTYCYRKRMHMCVSTSLYSSVGRALPWRAERTQFVSWTSQVCLKCFTFAKTHRNFKQNFKSICSLSRGQIIFKQLERQNPFEIFCLNFTQFYGNMQQKLKYTRKSSDSVVFF